MSTLNGVFIDVVVDEPEKSDVELAKKLEEVCPVSIFKATENGTELIAENLDECVLCYLCVEAAPEGTVHIIKKYEE